MFSVLEKANARPSMPFYRNGADFDKPMPVALISPVSSVAVPVTFVVIVPISVVPAVITAILVSFGGKRDSNGCTENEGR